MDKIQKTVALAIAFDKSQNILVSRRNDEYTPEAHNKWALIGGKVEYGENPEDTLKREFKEETGLEIENAKLLPKVFTQLWTNKHGQEYQVILLVYSCSIINPPENAVSQDPKISELKYISAKELDKYNFIELDAEIIKYLINQKP